MLDTLTQAEFDGRRNADELAVTFVGMSNVGKSYWSGRLAAEAGFDLVGCDSDIEEELGSVLQEQGFSGGIADMARWMGQPYDAQFAANQQTYLDLETMVMRRVLHRISQPPLGGNVVIDTTGSVVHTGDDLCQGLKLYSTIVYIEATPQMQQAMFRRYMAEPKPVVWGDIYHQEVGQSTEDALATCYPKLLAHRDSLYRRMAQVTLPIEVSHELANGEELLSYVRDNLPPAPSTDFPFEEEIA